MAKRAVFGLAASPNQVHQIVRRLRVAGFPHKDISVIFPKQVLGNEVPKGKNSEKDPWQPRLLSGAAAWTAARRIGFASVGALTTPGGDGLIAAGPIIFALSGDGTAIARGIAVGLMGIGISERDAKHYEGRLRKGNILIAVHTHTPEEMIPATEVFQQTGAEDICVEQPGENP